ncbi:hypothetical protein QFZ74_005935 [Streptomyces sp. V3I7]|nr:hypothetical protein [Streptomyces sp. V3I7]
MTTENAGRTGADGVITWAGGLVPSVRASSKPATLLAL